MPITKLSFRIRLLNFLFDTNAPFSVYTAWIKTYLKKKSIIKNYALFKDRFKADLLKGNFSNDYFTPHIPYWHAIFSENNLYEKNIEVLEIGSWEGMSSLFILSTLPNANLISVDTWGGADEHQGNAVLDVIEDNFDKNIYAYRDRLSKFKGTSFEFFNENKNKDRFDLIYVDGSHHTDDVIVDAIKSFELLKIGGIMIFDDYFWVHYSKPMDNPAGAINAFLRLKKGSYEILSVYSQLLLKKVRDGRPIP